MPTLGEKLARNIERENAAATDSEAALEQMRTEEDRRQFLIAQRFFEGAQEFFTQGITNAIPVKDLFLQIGGKGFSNGRDYHGEFSVLLRGYQASDHKRGPDALYHDKHLAALWSEFQQWARSEGLRAYFKNQWDGGGMDSWWELRVEQAVPRRA